MLHHKLTNFVLNLENKNPLNVAIAYILIAYFFHAVQITIFKSAHFTVVGQSLFFRSFISLLILFLLQRKEDFYPKDKTKYLVASQAFVAIGSLLYFQGLNYISLSEATILFSTNSIWSQLIVSFVSKKKITKSRIINSLICIIGIILIVNPKRNTEDSFKHIIGCLLILICSVIQSYGFVIMKGVGTTVKSTITTYYFHVMVIITSSLQEVYIGEFEYFDNYFIYIFGFTIFTMFGQLTQFRAQTMVTYDKICNYTYSQTLYIICLDYILFKKILSLNGIIGGGLILIGVFKQLSEDKKAQEQQ